VPSWIEGLRLRCGPLTDAALIFGAKLGVESDPPRGAHGLLALTHAIEQQAYTGPESEEDERLFVELAGAYLGLLLCDALGTGRHLKQGGRHGLSFDERGFFDAFVAIEHALEADDVCKALATQVALAEALACGTQLQGPRTDWTQAQAGILPRLVGPRFFAELLRGGAGQALCTVPVVGEMKLCFVLSEHGRVRYVRTSELERWMQSPEQVLHTARANLARRSDRAKLTCFDRDQGRLVVAKSFDGLDAARLLLPGLHDLLAPELGSPFVAAAPHRDALFACPLGSQTLSAMRERAAHEAAQARYAITAQLFLVEPNARLSLLTP
jgi:hypothetical protein